MNKKYCDAELISIFVFENALESTIISIVHLKNREIIIIVMESLMGLKVETAVTNVGTGFDGTLIRSTWNRV